MHRIIEVSMESGGEVILYDAADATPTEPVVGIQAIPLAPEDNESNE